MIRIFAASIILIATLIVVSYTAASASGTPAVREGLTALDWLIVAIYASGVILLGWFVGRGESAAGFFLSARGMHSGLIGISLFATLISTLSFLMYPGEVISNGPIVAIKILSYPLAFIFVSSLILPKLMRSKVTSVYELLEVPYGRETRLLGAVMFIILRLVWMTLLIHLAASAITVVLSLDESASTLVTVATVAIAIAYTTLGGFKAVVITDFIQALLLFVGAVAVIVTISVYMNGFSWFPTVWRPTWDTQPLFSFDPSTRATVVGTIMMYFFWVAGAAASDQISTQRFMSTKDLGAARRSFAIQLIAFSLITVLLMLVGFALQGFFLSEIGASVAQAAVVGDADNLFPLFIVNFMPSGFAGLLVAALFAAAMSSVDSGINSITAVLHSDILISDPDREASKRESTIALRLVGVLIGAAVVLLGLIVNQIPGNTFAIVGKTTTILTVPLFSLFIFALLLPVVPKWAVWAASLSSLIVGVLIAFSGPVFGYIQTTKGTIDPVSFQWIMPLAMATSLAVGWGGAALSSFKSHRHTPESPAIEGENR